MSRRTERVASVIRDVVAEGIRTQLSDPRLEPWTSITRVQVSPDLTVAHINVSVMSENPARRKLCVQALQAASGRLRAMLARRLVTRQIPRLEFHLDESVQQSLRTIDTIERVLAGRVRMEGSQPPSAASTEPARLGGAPAPEGCSEIGHPAYPGCGGGEPARSDGKEDA